MKFFSRSNNTHSQKDISLQGHKKNDALSAMKPHVKVITKPRVIMVNVGIDFGTSYSKASFSEQKIENYSVLFDGSEYKNSVLYYDYSKNNLSYNRQKENSNTEVIKYFKYTMINDSLPMSEHLRKLCLKTRPEILCGLFFIACLIKESKEYINAHYSNKRSNFSIEWNINLGVPIDNFSAQHKSLYDKILNIGIKLSECINEWVITLADLEQFYLQHETIDIPCFKASPFNTIPELYAECLAFFQDRQVTHGLYAIVDIGGGTVDMAVIHKKNDKRFSIVSKDIQALGIEVILNGITPDPKNLEKTRTALLEGRIDTDKVRANDEIEYRKKMVAMFGKLAMEIKSKVETRDALKKQKGKLPVILCGGGHIYKWYESCIKESFSNLKKTFCEEINGSKVEYTFEIIPIGKITKTTNTNNHRLLIAHSLAQRVEDIPDISGFPWDFENRISNNDKPDGWIQDQLDDIAREKYGEPL